MIAGQMDCYDVLLEMGVPAHLPPPQTCNVAIWGAACDLPFGHEGMHEGADREYPPDRLAWSAWA